MWWRPALERRKRLRCGRTLRRAFRTTWCHRPMWYWSGFPSRPHAHTAPEVRGLARRRGPRTPQEEILCALFGEVLGVSGVGIADNFFELGGDSIVSIQLVSRARKAGLVITPRAVF